MMKIIYSIIDKLLIIAVFIFMTVVLIFIVPIALVSVGWETGKEIKARKKIKWWGMN
jgi:hypothetical protein